MTDNTKDEREALVAQCKRQADIALHFRGNAAQAKHPDAYVPADRARAELLAAIDRLAALPAQPEQAAEARDRAALLAEVIELRAQLAEKQGHSVVPAITPHGPVNHGSDERASDAVSSGGSHTDQTKSAKGV